MRLLPIIAIFFSGICNSILAADRPNVLLIMADDLRDYGGAFTRDIVKTPNSIGSALVVLRSSERMCNIQCAIQVAAA